MTSTATAAPYVWKLIQAFYELHPEYESRGLSSGHQARLSANNFQISPFSRNPTEGKLSPVIHVEKQNANFYQPLWP